MDLSQTKILIVDDELDLRDMLVEIYEDAFSCNCVTAANGEEAIKILKEQKVNLLSTDYKMPFMDGKELITKLRDEVGPNQEVGILLVSAFGEEAETIISKYDDILLMNKPIEEEQLLSNAKIYLLKSLSL